MGPQLRFCRAHHRAGALGARSDALAKDEDLAGIGVRRHRPGCTAVDAVDPEDQAVILGLVPAYEPAHDLGHLARMSGCSCCSRQGAAPRPSARRPANLAPLWFQYFELRCRQPVKTFLVEALFP